MLVPEIPRVTILERCAVAVSNGFVALVCFWHLADIAIVLNHVRFRG
jgi:hypothetical protein